MDNRLTLHDIAALLAEHSGKSVPDSELFLQELIQSLSEICVKTKLSK